MSSFFVSSIKEDAMVDLEWTAMQEALGSDVDGNVDPDDGALVACFEYHRKCKRPPK